MRARQAQMVREAIAPYLSLPTLRRLVANGGDVQAAFTSLEPPPQAVQGLVSLLRVLLTPHPTESITTAADIAALLMLEMGLLDHEEFWLVCLDTKHHVQRLQRLYQGSVNSLVVRIAEVFQLPVLLKSLSIIVAHSHPSGNPQPSPEDLSITRKLVKAGTSLQIEVLDHLIIAQGSWVSLRVQHMDCWR